MGKFRTIEPWSPPVWSGGQHGGKGGLWSQADSASRATGSLVTLGKLPYMSLLGP